MHIRWIADSPDRSIAASHRYRMHIPAKVLRDLGHTVDIVPLNDARPSGADVSVLGKVFIDGDFQAKAKAMLEAASGRVVVDVCDNHFDKPKVGDYWKQACSRADVCVVASPAMGEVVSRYTSSPVVVIGDPLASPYGSPRAYKPSLFIRKPLKVAWYGMINNVTAMERAAFDIMDRLKEPMEFHLCTSKNQAVDHLCEVFSTEFKKARMFFHEWSEETQWKMVSECDVVLIPTNPSDAAKAVKSANRMTDAINAGRYVIASPIPAYQPFAKVASVTTDIPAALKWYTKNPAEALAKIAKGQELVKACSPESIAQAWLRAFAPPSAYREAHAS